MHVNFYLYWSYFLGAYQFILHEQAQKELIMMIVILKKIMRFFFPKTTKCFLQLYIQYKTKQNKNFQSRWKRNQAFCEMFGSKLRHINANM